MSTRFWFAMALAAAAPACTERTVRPGPTATLVDVYADDEGQGLLIFEERGDGAWGRHTFVRQTAEGVGTWQQALAERYRLDLEEPPVALGAVMVVPVIAEPEVPRGSLLHLRLADGATREWSPSVPRVVDTVVVGDAAQAIVVWRGLPAAPDYPAPLSIAAHDLASGERTWTTDDTTHAERMFVRLDEGHVLIGAPGADWQALRRSDGSRVALPIADAPGMCRAGDRWLARRDDQLLAIDLRGATPGHQAAPATFVAPEMIHQWSLVDCAAHGDEVVLLVNVEPTGGGLIAGIDADTLATRWTLELPLAFEPIEGPGTPGALPSRVGDTIVVAQGQPRTYPVPCAIDLVGRRVRWCGAERGTRFLADGEDWLIQGFIGDKSPHAAFDAWVVRVGGGDGEVAAARMTADGPGLVRHLVGGGELWLPLYEGEAPAPDELGLAVLDARTLEPVAPEGFGRRRAASGVQDAMAVVDEVFVRLPDLPQELDPGPERPRHAGDPLDELITGHPTWQDAMAPADRADLVAAVTRGALLEAGLPPDMPMRVLASRHRFLVGFVAHAGADGPRWTLVKGRSALGVDDTAARTFRRRPAAVDVYRFLRDVEPREQTYGAGEIDEAAWIELTGAPREPQAWLLH